MTTPTRPLPPGVEIRQFQEGWYPCIPSVGDRSSVLFRTGIWSLDSSEWIGDNGFPTEADATAAYFAWHDKQPENQPKGEVPQAHTAEYRRGLEDGKKQAFDQIGERLDSAMEACRAACVHDHLPDDKATVEALLDKTDECRRLREQVASLIARVAALEAKDQPKPSPGPRLIEGMNQLRDAVRNGTLDQLPTAVVARCGDRTVRYTREPEAAPPPSPSAEPSHREPVVGMAYRIKDAADTPASSGRWMLMPNGEVKFNEGTDDAPRWEDAGTTGMELRSFVASGYFVPVPGYKVEGSPQ